MYAPPEKHKPVPPTTSHAFQLAAWGKQNSTASERKMHRLLLRYLKGIHVEFQWPFGPYVADFAIKSYRLIVEVDGPHHQRSDFRRHDHRRDAFFRERGWGVVRVSTDLLWDQPDRAIWRVLEAVDAKLGRSRMKLARRGPRPSEPNWADTLTRSQGKHRGRNAKKLRREVEVLFKNSPLPAAKIVVEVWPATPRPPQLAARRSSPSRPGTPSSSP